MGVEKRDLFNFAHGEIHEVEHVGAGRHTEVKFVQLVAEEELAVILRQPAVVRVDDAGVGERA